MGSFASSIAPGPTDVGVYDQLSVVEPGSDLETRKQLKRVEIETKSTILNPYSLSQAGITVGYIDRGIATFILVAPVGYYMIYTLDASSTQYNAFLTLLTLPASLQFLLGMLSDEVDIFGYKRKSWMLLGWVFYSLSSIYLWAVGTPDITQITIWMFLMTSAYLLSDVCTDTLVCERAKYEYEAISGNLQTAGFIAMSFGMIIGSLIGALLYNTSDWGWGLTISELFFLNALVPVFGIFLVWWWLVELAPRRAKPTLAEEFLGIWDTLQLNAVWWPMIFIYTFFLFQIPNAAWNNFLILGLNFSEFDFGLLTIFSACLSMLGLIIFKAFLFETTWRNIYIYTSIVGVIFSVMQILLVLRVNVSWGIPDIVFALSDAYINQILFTVQVMPSTIIFMHLVPEGSEGAAYSLLNAIGVLAMTVASDIGTALTLIWDVSNDTIESGDYDGVLYLTILTSLLSLLPLCLLWILPADREEQRILRDCGKSNYWGGFGLSSVIIVSLVITIALNIYFIWY